MINKESVDIPDTMPGSVPLDAMLFAQNLAHDMHCNIIRSIV